MKVFKLRVLLDSEDTVFRDIEIKASQTFENLHNAILDAFEFDGSEMASFYLSNDNWDKGKEIPLEDISDDEKSSIKTMSSTKISDHISEMNQKLVYVYDFLKMWCFFVEVLGITEEDKKEVYPFVSMSYGDSPEENSREADYSEDFDDLEGFDDEENFKKQDIDE
ncbi:MAG: IS1096 element passenger TnpR family protein, partial [Bacteroidia bacterium]